MSSGYGPPLASALASRRARPGELERDDRPAGGGGGAAAEGVLVGGELRLLAVPDRRVPDLHRQRAVVGGMGVRGRDVDHVELVGVGEREPAHTDVERAASGQLGRVRAHVAGHRVPEIREARLAGRRVRAAARAAGARVVGQDRAGRGGREAEHRAADEELATGECALTRRFDRGCARVFWVVIVDHRVPPSRGSACRPRIRAWEVSVSREVRRWESPATTTTSISEVNAPYSAQGRAGVLG